AARLALTRECLSRVTQVDYDLCAQMQRAGCKRVFFGIESGDEGVLKQMRKGITPAQAQETVEACVRAGIKAAGFFMVGYLGETPESLARTIRFSSHLPLDYVSYTIAYPLPGPRFYGKLRRRGACDGARRPAAPGARSPRVPGPGRDAELAALRGGGGRRRDRGGGAAGARSCHTMGGRAGRAAGSGPLLLARLRRSRRRSPVAV